jgi:hypothetical protein
MRKVAEHVLVAIMLVSVIPLALLYGLAAWLVRLVLREKHDYRAEITQAMLPTLLSPDASMTGYEITQAVNRSHWGNHWWNFFGTGQLYSELEKMLRDGLVMRIEEPDNSKRRYTWRLM